MKASNTHSSNLYRIGRITVSFTNLTLIFEEIVDLATQLWILVEVGEVWFGYIYLSCICVLLLLLVLYLIHFGGLTIVDSIIHFPLLLLGLVQLLEHLRGHPH